MHIHSNISRFNMNIYDVSMIHASIFLLFDIYKQIMMNGAKIIIIRRYGRGHVYRFGIPQLIL